VAKIMADPDGEGVGTAPQVIALNTGDPPGDANACPGRDPQATPGASGPHHPESGDPGPPDAQVNGIHLGLRP
jgi:hypothetical protein